MVQRGERLLVKADQALTALDHGLSVERQSRVDLGGDAPGDQFQNLLAYRDGEQVARQTDVAVALLHRVRQVIGITRHGRCFEQQ